MSACYGVTITLKFKSEEDKAKATEVLRNEIKKHSPKNWCYDENNQFNTFEDCMKVYLGEEQGNYLFEEKNGCEVYSSAFNASYSWGWELEVMKNLIKPYLAQSRFCISE